MVTYPLQLELGHLPTFVPPYLHPHHLLFYLQQMSLPEGWIFLMSMLLSSLTLLPILRHSLIAVVAQREQGDVGGPGSF
jgi:hypothetical protein